MLNKKQRSKIKVKFQAWVERHPDVFHADTFWYVQNCVGDLIDWKELPTEWIKNLEATKKEAEKRTEQISRRARHNNEFVCKVKGQEVRIMLEPITFAVRPPHKKGKRVR